MITLKDAIKFAAKEYVRQYQTEINIYDALKPLNIYVDIEGDKKTAYLEHLFDEIAEDLCQALCDFAADGSILLNINDRWTDVTDIDTIIDVYMEGIE